MIETALAHTGGRKKDAALNCWVGGAIHLTRKLQEYQDGESSALRLDEQWSA